MLDIRGRKAKRGKKEKGGERERKEGNSNSNTGLFEVRMMPSKFVFKFFPIYGVQKHSDPI